MVFHLLAMAFADGEIAAVFSSPYIVPVAGCFMILGITATSIWSGVRTREIRSHERLARIAQGLPAEGEWEEREARTSILTADSGDRPRTAVKVNDGGGARRAGIVLVSIGLGLFLFFATLAVIVQVRQVLAGGAAGILPLAIGLGFLVDARIKKAEYERRFGGTWQGLPGAGAEMSAGVGAGPVSTAAPPPPPPVGMSAAQASDWRPLH